MSNFEDKKVEITQDDFKLVQREKKISDLKFESKPTTFIKDAIKRFRKNKSSVVAAIILSILILLAIFVPVISQNDTKKVRKPEQFLAPKLFNAGTGWWDGTKEYTHVVYDAQNQVPAGYRKSAVLNLKVDETPSLINQANKYGTGGYVMFGNTGPKDQVNRLSSTVINFTKAGNYSVAISFGDIEDALGGKLTQYKIALVNPADRSDEIVLQDYTTDYSDVTINISEKLGDKTNFNGEFTIYTKSLGGVESYVLVKSVVFTADESVAGYDTLTNEISFTDATKMILVDKKDEEGTLNPGYWSCTGRKGIFNSEIYYCDFTFDTYANAYDEGDISVSLADIKKYVEKGYCSFEVVESFGQIDKAATIASFKVLDQENCPIKSITDINVNTIGKVLGVYGTGYRYLSYGYDKMPIFLFGTDGYGHDLFTKAFKGLRTSLILGFCTAAFCLAFGLLWGSISGYFGGNVDILMERFCEILSGIPWIVIMTLAILLLGNNFVTFFLALCLTGWMGTAARTRTQFYRFKGREYVLASRTLGASDARLIFKHILPNSLGTIITSSVLMIPSVIFSEATLAYLNLGLRGVDSFGVLMSENQQYLQAYPNLVIFPACIIALMMISFNLFGNGLRDAINPSLKGSE